MKKLKVFFDGACHLCSREIDYYRRIDLDGRIEFVDIADPKFKAESFGLEDRNFRKHLHVRNQSDEVKVGVDAFNEIWKTLGIFKPLSWAVENSFTRPILKAGYWCFAEVRPLLPKRGCEGQCDIPA